MEQPTDQRLDPAQGTPLVISEPARERPATQLGLQPRPSGRRQPLRRHRPFGLLRPRPAVLPGSPPPPHRGRRDPAGPARSTGRRHDPRSTSSTWLGHRACQAERVRPLPPTGSTRRLAGTRTERPPLRALAPLRSKTMHREPGLSVRHGSIPPTVPRRGRPTMPIRSPSPTDPEGIADQGAEQPFGTAANSRAAERQMTQIELAQGNARQRTLGRCPVMPLSAL